MKETMIEIYTDVFCTVKEEYGKELEMIKSDGEFVESLIFENLRNSIEES